MEIAAEALAPHSGNVISSIMPTLPLAYATKEAVLVIGFPFHITVPFHITAA